MQSCVCAAGARHGAVPGLLRISRSSVFGGASLQATQAMLEQSHTKPPSAAWVARELKFKNITPDVCWQASLLGRLRQGGRGGWSLGASGAVYACFAASAVLFPDHTAVLIFLPDVRPAYAPAN